MAEYKLTHTQAVRILAACKYDEALARRALEGKMEG
jgi:hypothetical protein